ncbi:lipase 1 [Manduca sexta]|uniref:Lipase n=1 Tax=Manduca sexta TaxID=7130 RepID=A0A921ZMP6_MANSE|nr:lipase 1 [Manduca sexta]KAG6460501.1 hypothetical protein O3G_MSEX012027 [Manduca sexta]
MQPGRTLLVLVLVSACSIPAARQHSSNGVTLNFTEAVARNGYQSETHSVLTEDGYLLTLFRLGKNRGTPTLLVHGLLQSADCWIDSGPDAGLGYLIAAAGYDLWLGNVRGNYYSRAHTHLRPEDPAFWDFSTDEIGLYDVPAMVDYVLQQTGAKKLNYIGFSQGAGALFMTCSERSHYCSKVNVIIALSPSMRHKNTRSPLFRLVTEGSLDYGPILRSVGIHEVFTRGTLTQEILSFFCNIPELIIFCTIFKEMLDAVYQLHKPMVTEETIRTLVTHFPSGTSVKNMVRFGQAMKNEEFIKFDYGEENLQRYGSVLPPKYNFEAVNVPVVAIYGKNDGIVDIKDVEWGLQKLPVVLESYVIKDPHWSHLDMNYSKNTKRLVFPKINKYLSMFSL